MIELTLYEWLKKTMSEPVYMEHPLNPPKKYVFLEKTSDLIENHISHATIAVQAYADTLYGAAKLCEDAIGAMLDAPQMDEVCAVRLNNSYNFTDTATKSYRYQAVFDVTYY